MALGFGVDRSRLPRWLGRLRRLAVRFVLDRGPALGPETGGSALADSTGVDHELRSAHRRSIGATAAGAGTRQAEGPLPECETVVPLAGLTRPGDPRCQDMYPPGL